MIYYPKCIYHMDDSKTMVQDEAQHKAKGDGWFESPATARDALEQLARSKPPLESLRFSDNHRLIDAVYEILYKDAKGPEQWRIVREYLENFPGSAFESTWAKQPISLIQQVETLPSTAPAGGFQSESQNVIGQTTKENTPRKKAGRKASESVEKRNTKIAVLKKQYEHLKGLNRNKIIAQKLDEQNEPPPKHWGVPTYKEALKVEKTRKAFQRMVSKAE